MPHGRPEITARLRQETTPPIKAISAGVHWGTSKTANAKLHRCMRQGSAAGAGQAQLDMQRGIKVL
jgi:hypothetical protein